MIARPTAASAAATVMTKNTITCPSIEWSGAASATKARLTAFSMSSIDMKMTITLRRTSTPDAPIAKRTRRRGPDTYSIGTTVSPRPRLASTTAPTMATSSRIEVISKDSSVVGEQRSAPVPRRSRTRDRWLQRRPAARRVAGRTRRARRRASPPTPSAVSATRSAAASGSRLEVEQHDHEQEQHHDRAGVDDHLKERHQLRVEQNEHHGDQEQRHHQRQRRIDGLRWRITPSAEAIATAPTTKKITSPIPMVIARAG